MFMFNMIEGTFWLACAGVSFFVGTKLPTMTRRFWGVLTLLFVLFGISDYVEANYGPSIVEPAGYWLFAWKSVCVIGFTCCIIWYFVARLRSL